MLAVPIENKLSTTSYTAITVTATIVTAITVTAITITLTAITITTATPAAITTATPAAISSPMNHRWRFSGGDESIDALATRIAAAALIQPFALTSGPRPALALAPTLARLVGPTVHAAVR